MLKSLLILLLLLSTSAQALTESEGQTESGAFYRFAVPDGWTAADGLAIWNHGFSFSPIEQNDDLGPLVDIQLEQGYAVAASSYSVPGWATFNTVQDVRQMVTEFTEQFAKPESIIVTGGSLGGIVTAQVVEQAGLDNVDGALSACGVTLGSRVWEAALDVRLIYEQVCAGVPGAQIGGAATGLGEWVPPEVTENENFETLLASILGLQINACTGIAFPAALRDPKDQERLDRILELTGLPNEDFFVTVMAYATFMLADLTFDPKKLDGGIGVGNIGVDYGDDEVNASIRRVQADPVAQHWLKHQYLPTGRVGDTKVLAIHTDKDGLVIVQNMRDWAAQLPADQISTAVVVEDVASHCGFSDAELLGSWESLRSWVAGGPQPDAAAQQAACEQAVDTETASGPCRIDPDFVIAPTSDKLSPRPPAYVAGAEISGSWWNEARGGEGFLIQALDSGRAVVYWFTYPESTAQNLDEKQIWMLGEGAIEGDTIVIEDVIRTGGARFGDAFNSDDLSITDWGMWRFSFSGCDAGVMSYTGPAGFDEGRNTTARLSRLAGNDCNAADKAASAGFSATWYAPTRSGEGFLVEELADGATVIYWFTYDDQGNQVWMQGTGNIVDNVAVFDAVIMTEGAAFGADFNPQDIQINSFGSITMTLDDDCRTAVMEWSTADPRFVTVSNRQTVERLSSPAGESCESR